MEYAEENLAQILPQRALTPRKSRDLLEPALDTLAFIHGKSLAHGRLKPSNIMAAQDQLKLSSDSLVRVDEPAGGSLKEARPIQVSTTLPRLQAERSLPLRIPGRWA